MAIRILVTGGTFDKEYDELTGRLYFKDTHIEVMLRLGRCGVPVAVETVMMRAVMATTKAKNFRPPCPFFLRFLAIRGSPAQSSGWSSGWSSTQRVRPRRWWERTTTPACR